MKKIICSKCGQEDHLSFVPKENKPLMCRSCAERELQVVEEQGRFSADKIQSCRQCGSEVMVAKRPQRRMDGDVPAAPDAMAGLCPKCRVSAQARRRQEAQRPGGVHPLVVKNKSRS